MGVEERQMKMRVAGTLKWNIVDKISTQILYAITGVILARVLTQSDFGLIGAILIFQTFASLFIEGGFSYALVQRKSPTDADYSSVFWFNMGVAAALYSLLFVSAPWIATWFKGAEQLVPMSRVMFLTFIINNASLVQLSMRMKRMDMKMVAVANSMALIGGAVTGLWMALTGWGAWALVWQAVTVSTVKTAVLWLSSRWRPTLTFSWQIIRSYFRVGGGMLAQSFLNTLFQNLYSFFIGNRAGLVSLGYYTQADKWSKMGVQSMSASLTSSFLPALSNYQDQPQAFAAAASKMNRLSSYLASPFIVVLIAMATPIFHALFGEKWDPAIVLFQLLLVRGWFTIFTALYNNYMVSIGKARMVVWTEIVRDSIAVVAIAVTFPYITMSVPGNPTYGLAIFLWGQVIAAATAWAFMLVLASRIAWSRPQRFLMDLAPYLALSLLTGAMVWAWTSLPLNPWLMITVQGVTALTVYLGACRIAGSVIQRDVLQYLRSQLRGKKVDDKENV